VVDDDGAPIEESATDVQASVAEWAEVGEALQGAIPGSTVGQAEPHILVRRGVPLAWEDYLTLEAAARSLLGERALPLTERLLHFDALVQESGSHAEPGGMRPWVDSLTTEGWKALQPNGPQRRISPLRQRAVVAPIVGAIEEGTFASRIDSGNASATARLSRALAIVQSSGDLRLNSADAILDLSAMKAVRFAQDDAVLMEPIVRFLRTFLARKGLISGTSLLQGSRYLALYVATIRWYAVAGATLAEHDAVSAVDVRHAVQLVERTLSRSPSLKSPDFMRLINLLFQWVASPSALYPSTYPV
ncbi:MAG: hypothetical protein QOF51_2827, partial [Chloroflexota bacterium]|nr:hypothetical protein [Chloroflexota bacterium]